MDKNIQDFNATPMACNATLVGNVMNILVTCHLDMCRSCTSDDIFNVADTMTGSQLWSSVGKIP